MTVRDQRVDLLNCPGVRFILRTGLLPLPSHAKLFDDTNTQSCVWLPIAVPFDATVMEFDFTVNGARAEAILGKMPVAPPVQCR